MPANFTFAADARWAADERSAQLGGGRGSELRAGPVAGVKEIALAQRTLTAILARIGITLSFPWRDFSTFKAHWVRNGCYNSWQASRDLLNELFAPVQAELDRQEDAQFCVVNAEAVSPHTKTGWPKVDEELAELRRRFRTAATTQDYRDTGNRAVAVLEAISRTVYDPAVARARRGD